MALDSAFFKILSDCKDNYLPLVSDLSLFKSFNGIMPKVIKIVTQSTANITKQNNSTKSVFIFHSFILLR